MCVCVCVCVRACVRARVCGRIMDKLIVRGLDAQRTDYCRTGACIMGCYAAVQLWAGSALRWTFCSRGFALLQSCTCRGVKYWETLEKLVIIGTDQNSCPCRLTPCRWIRSTAEITRTYSLPICTEVACLDSNQTW